MTEGAWPDIAKKGVPIEIINPQPMVRKTAETKRDWDYGPVLADLHRKNEVIYHRFFNGVAVPGWDDTTLPLLAVENLRNLHTLAAYLLVPDEYGFTRKISFNEQHFTEGVSPTGEAVKAWACGLWALLETIEIANDNDVVSALAKSRLWQI